METCSSDDWTLDIGVGEAWAYFRRCRSVEKFVGGIWGNFRMGCRAGRSARLVTQESLGSSGTRGYLLAVSAVRFGMWNSFSGELCEDIMETLVCPHAILISDGHGFNDLTRWQCSGTSGSVVASQL